MKWSPPGGRVDVRLVEGRLTVTDQGPGIADTDLPYVFDRFYRSTDARAMPGSGLGLAIVRQTAERHGGSVSAGRSSSGGAMLVLELPGHAVREPEAAVLNDREPNDPLPSEPLPTEPLPTEPLSTEPLLIDREPSDHREPSGHREPADR